MIDKAKVVNETSNSIAQATEKALDFLNDVLTSPVKELTGLLADQVKFWRFKNQVNVIIKARQFLESKGIKPKKISIKNLSNLLEYASFEEEEEMQTRWASLLANAANPNNKYDLCSVFSQILNQLSPHEALILDYMFSKCFWMSDRDRAYLDRKEIIRLKFTNYEVSLLIFDNLLRLRLIEEEPPKIVNERDPYRETEKIFAENSSSIRLSEFGVEFVRQSKFEI